MIGKEAKDQSADHPSFIKQSSDHSLFTTLIWSTIVYIQILASGDTMRTTMSSKSWTIAEAKARLSEVLRRAEQEGPQRIGKRKVFIVAPAEVWEACGPLRKPLGQWLVKSAPHGANLPVPSRREHERPIPFVDELDA